MARHKAKSLSQGRKKILKGTKTPLYDSPIRPVVSFWEPHFPFLSLPPEIRNRIFEYLLVTPSPLIEVRNLSEEEFKRKKRRKAIQRTTYTIKNPEVYLEMYDSDDSFTKNGPIDEFITTYTMDRSGLDRGSAWNAPCMATLRLNRQIHQEASPIFYGSNDFYFDEPSTLAHFLQDRPSAALQSLRKFKIVLRLDPCGGEFGRNTQTWANCLHCLGKYSEVKLLELSVDIEGQEDDLQFMRKKGFHFEMTSRSLSWISALSESIWDLDRLGVTYRCNMMTFCREAYHSNGMWISNATVAGRWVPVDAAVEKLNQELWDYLAPIMLKQYGVQKHGHENLQSRRIETTVEGTDGVLRVHKWDHFVEEDDETQRRYLDYYFWQLALRRAMKPTQCYGICVLCTYSIKAQKQRASLLAASNIFALHNAP